VDLIAHAGALDASFGHRPRLRQGSASF